MANGAVVRSPEWLRAAVADKVARPGVVASVDDVAARVAGAVTYTVVLDDDRYVDGTRALCAALTGSHEVVAWHNRWHTRWCPPGVRGGSVVVRGRAPASAPVEVQVHTPASAAARDEALALEAHRRATADPADAAALERLQNEVLAAVPTPAGALGLGRPRGGAVPPGALPRVGASPYLAVVEAPYSSPDRPETLARRDPDRGGGTLRLLARDGTWRPSDLARRIRLAETHDDAVPVDPATARQVAARWHREGTLAVVPADLSGAPR